MIETMGERERLDRRAEDRGGRDRRERRAWIADRVRLPVEVADHEVRHLEPLLVGVPEDDRRHRAHPLARSAFEQRHLAQHVGVAAPPHALRRHPHDESVEVAVRSRTTVNPNDRPACPGIGCTSRTVAVSE